MTIRISRHHASEADPLGRGGDRRQQRPAFIHRTLAAVRADGSEVVEVPDVVETPFVGDPPDVAERLDRGRLTGVLESDAKWVGHGSRLLQSRRRPARYPGFLDLDRAQLRDGDR